METKIIEPSGAEEFRKYYALRFEILRKPWNQPESSTRDEWENDSLHVLIMNAAGDAVATGRLQLNSKDEGQIRSMAVRSDLQGQGLGSEIMKYIEEKAKQKNLTHIVLDARENAVAFYEKHGYRVIGESYLLFGIIRHHRMRKEL